MLAHKGYAGASVDDIAEEAGFTVGALYSNFGSKQNLVLAAFERHCDQDLAQIQALLGSDLTLEQQLDAIGSQFGDLDDEHRRWWLLSMELWLYAQRDPAARARLAALRRKVRQTIADTLQRQAERTGRRLPVPAMDLAAAMLGLCCIAGAITVGTGLAGLSAASRLMDRYQPYLIATSVLMMAWWLLRTLRQMGQRPAGRQDRGHDQGPWSAARTDGHGLRRHPAGQHGALTATGGRMMPLLPRTRQERCG